MTPDDALAEVRRRAAGRTRYEGQEPRADEVLAEEVERLRAALQELLLDAERYFSAASIATRETKEPDSFADARRALGNDRD
jgi:hypothetical protein